MSESRVRLDKIASVTRNCRLAPDVVVSPKVDCRAGAVLAVRILGEKGTYNQLEDVHGRMSFLHGGDVIAGALGHRNALHGYSGVVPEKLAVGETVHVLNLGGVLGHCVSHNPEVGEPFRAEVLGSVLAFPTFQSRSGVPAHISMNALPPAEALEGRAPVVFVAGTCMNAGKTLAACQIVRHLAHRGLKVGGAKLTGISLMRDVLSMRDYGAWRALTFTDVGVVATDPATAVPASRAILGELARGAPDVIVAELGDGILGDYGVQSILSEPAFRGRAAAMVLCANDPVGAWGGVEILRRTFQWGVNVVSGPATDNEVGCRYVRDELNVPALNARTHGPQLAEQVADKVAQFSGAAA
ncbi:MAG: hypothetical protein HZB25_05785 [Candidatus Eisenbacteria bacterium]|nr:hypothetical protein [Candidatus Eisenbacteria bacterium]